MDIEKCIKQIVDTGTNEDMHELSDMLEDSIEDIKEYDENKYKEYEMKLYKLANGNVLNLEMAEEIVSNMKPYRMRWSIEETNQLQREYGLNNINEIDFFVVINSAYNDYKDIFGDNIENYIKFTIDFIEDEDAKKDKIFLYFTLIPKK